MFGLSVQIWSIHEGKQLHEPHARYNDASSEKKSLQISENFKGSLSSMNLLKKES